MSAGLKRLFPSVKFPVIGMIHVKALPGSPRSRYSVQQLVDTACREAIVYEKHKVDGILVENMFDLPYLRASDAGPELTAIMTRVCSEIKKVVPKKPCGVQILAGNNISALAVASAAGYQFIRAEGFIFAHVADEGMMDACAGPLLRYRRNISAEDILVLTDIKKKHSSHAITEDIDLVQTAKAAEFFLSDGVIVTGNATGEAPSAAHTRAVHTAISLPVIAGSGITKENIKDFFFLDGAIVGSYFKYCGQWQKDLQPEKIAAFIDEVDRLRDKSDY